MAPSALVFLVIAVATSLALAGVMFRVFTQRRSRAEAFSDPAGKVVALDLVIRLLELILLDSIDMQAKEVILDFDGTEGQIIHRREGGDTVVTRGVLARAREVNIYHGPESIEHNLYRALVARTRTMAGLDPQSDKVPEDGYFLVRLVDEVEERPQGEHAFAVSIFHGSTDEPAVLLELLDPAPQDLSGPA